MRQRRKETRPQELLDAALALFVEKGFAATRYHSLLVERATFPKDLEITAETAEGEEVPGLVTFEAQAAWLFTHGYWL